MNRSHAVLLTITAASVLAVAFMIFIVPDHSGELRTDLEVGDYYTLGSSGSYNTIRYEIVDINEDGTLIVNVSSDSSTPYTQEMTKDTFLKKIYLKDSQAHREDNKRMIINTGYGKRVCYLYSMDLNRYWVDSHGVIYRSFIGGLDAELVQSSLIK